MKWFKIVFESGKEEEVDADRWEIHDSSYLFYVGDRALDGFSIPEDSVAYITVLSQNIEEDLRPRT